jgi:threonine synthase
MKGIWKYSHLLPPVEESCKMTLGEGDTPLIRSRQLGTLLGLDNLYFKLELVNPSGSYKDRFAACAVSNLRQRDIRFCLATSSGNTGSALASYCAAAGIKCYLAIVDGAPSGKLQQMQVYGSETMMIKDFGKNPQVSKEVFSGLNATADKHGTSVQISAYRYSPLGMAGVQTIAYEIAEDLPNIENVFSPAGGGGLILALTRGFQTWKEQNPKYKIPKVHCVQPVGNSTISEPLRNGLAKAQAVSQSTTSISGLQVPNVIDGDEVIHNCRETGGTGYTVTDDLIYEYQELLATKEGIYCEPAGAVALAGLVSALEKNEIDKRDRIVCLITGHGFKDPVSAEKIAGKANGHFFYNAHETLGYIEAQIKK